MEELDLRGIICPYNFVKTKLKLDMLEVGSQLAVLLDEGDPINNVPKSIMNEGHQVLTQEKIEAYYRIVIQKEDS
ncbi:MAG: sulfurtransferase TusA family protein [Nitrospirota bacterium]|nr:sulfurtransferase TusA family protein [Nitrospirota bacterium]MDH5775534.1 sulfurtransferase TusA family protein [Nitrospirota bacterium]